MRFCCCEHTLGIRPSRECARQQTKSRRSSSVLTIRKTKQHQARSLDSLLSFPECSREKCAGEQDQSTWKNNCLREPY